MSGLTNIELITEDALSQKYSADGKSMFAEYVHERDFIHKNILEEIKLGFPDGSDHGARHVRNVLENCEKLLGIEDTIYDKQKSLLRPEELLILITSVLYHDLGNVSGRKEHQKKVEGVYNQVWGSKTENRHQHRDLIRAITLAHCGKAQDGSTDTLKELSNSMPFRGNPIRSQEIAAILRFADELAEGPQRTSLYRHAIDDYEEDSKLFHAYARATDITIDRQSRRVALTYYINSDPNIATSELAEAELESLLNFIFKRIDKVDEERQYNRHYTDIMVPFKETSVTFNFSVNSCRCDIGLPELLLTDLSIPGTPRPTLQKRSPSYSVSSIIEKLKQGIKDD